MTTLPSIPCLLLTQDPGLCGNLSVAVPPGTPLQPVADRAELLRWMERIGPAQLVLDLRHPDSAGFFAEASPDLRSTLVLIGLPGSEPYQACQDAGAFALVPLDSPPQPLRQILQHALAVLRLQEEVRFLRQTAPSSEPPPRAPVDLDPNASATSLYQFARASRCFQDAPKLLDHVVDGIAATSRIARVGIFARLRDQPDYRLHTGLRCLDATEDLRFLPHDPLVRWLDRHAHLVCRTNLAHIAEPHERLLLLRALDTIGAEILVPLSGKRGLLGWIFAGHRATGIPFSPRDLADLSVMGEHVATLLENALLVEEIAIQKTLAENLLETIPVGILAASEDGAVRWFNRAAEEILGISASQIINQPVERAGSRPADLLRRSLMGEPPAAPVQWTEPASRRSIVATAHRVGPEANRLGAMLLLTDATRERVLLEQQKELERRTFWNDLAAAMSHEVRNPLVAISTFAQLLPERHADPEFREKFHTVVVGEVARLNAIIAQINAFAHPPPLTFKSADAAQIASLAVARATSLVAAEVPRMECVVEPGVPRLRVDEHAIVDALSHLLANACEAVRGRPDARVRLQIRRIGADGAGGTACVVSDNGPGIPPELREKMFSPFVTSKPRGMGLGLPLAQQTIVDHGGRIDVDSTPDGTTITMTLPPDGERKRDGQPAGIG